MSQVTWPEKTTEHKITRCPTVVERNIQMSQTEQHVTIETPFFQKNMLKQCHYPTENLYEGDAPQTVNINYDRLPNQINLQDRDENMLERV